MSDKEPRVICIACSTFQNEMEELRKAGELDLPVRYLDSELHNYPAELCRQLGLCLDEELGQGKKVVCLYGECHHHMHEQETRPGVRRVCGLNCCEILLGRDRYRALRKEGAFFLTAEWTQRGVAVLEFQLGMDGPNARALMADSHRKLVYLDTGVIPVPVERLKEFSEFTGLPVEVETVPRDRLLAGVREALEEAT